MDKYIMRYFISIGLLLSLSSLCQGAYIKGDLLLRDAIYLYEQQLDARGSKVLVGENCDVFQLVLDVNTGFADIAISQSSTVDAAVGSTNFYPDTIYDSAAMFAYALYDNKPVKIFSFGDARNITSTTQVGMATIFGYCYSINPSARVYFRELDLCTDEYSTGQSTSVLGCVK